MVSSEPLALGAPVNPGHALRLDLFVFAGTPWKTEEIRAAATGAAHLLAQCGIAIDPVQLRTLDAPRPFQFYSTTVSQRLVQLLEANRPAVFFVEDTLNRPAFDAEAIGLANSATRPELANTVWVAHGARDLAVTLAHELVHVLSDNGEHSDAPGNLMRPDTGPFNTILSAVQCETLRERGETNGLLQRRAKRD